MYPRLIISVAMAALCFPWIGIHLVRSEEVNKDSGRTTQTPEQNRKAIERGLTFLQQDAVKWRKERGCATCHHGTMTVWALSEAKSQGFAVSGDFLSEATQWTKDQFMPRFVKPRDPREGWNLVGIPAIYLGVMSQNLPVLSRDEIQQIAGHLARHQEEDGSWLMPRPANGAPPTWESPETIALLAYLAWEAYVPADPTEAAKISAIRVKAVAWLDKTKTTDTTQTRTLRLLVDVRGRKSAKEINLGIEGLLSRQNADGGWSQAKDIPSDAYATGQALWALSFAGVKNDRSEITRAVSFLVGNQREDGSWPMTRRSHPGHKPGSFTVPITYFGSAWGTIGLVRSVSPAPDTPSNRQRAFDEIKRFHGKYDVDKDNTDRPVVSVDLRYYQIDDDALANFAKVLQAFPRLAELQFKSAKITDAGLAHLQSLSGLRKLSLENAVITDAGLERLRSMSKLEELNVKGTKVSEAGVQKLQKTLPKVKIEH